MAAALGLDSLADASAYQLYLAQVIKDAGAENDPVKKMLLQQLCLAHFRIAKLHMGAEYANDAETVRTYSAAAARLLGELRRTALVINMMGGSTTSKRGGQNKLKVLKMAQ